MVFNFIFDFCDLHMATLDEIDHTIGAPWGCHIVEISTAIIDELGHNHHRIMRALWWATLVDEDTLRSWLVSMGQRPADRQMAHLVCELLVQLQTVGCANPDSFEFPLSQVDIADRLAYQFFVRTGHCESTRSLEFGGEIHAGRHCTECDFVQNRT